MRSTKDRNCEADDDLPASLDPQKLRFVGVGLKALPPYRGSRAVAGARPVAVTLADDVAAVFKDSTSVNNVLRAIILSMPGAKKRRKSA
jgi:hypothetical protein